MGVSETYRRGRTFVADRPAAAILAVFGVLLGLDFVRRLATGVVGYSQFATYLWEGLVIGLLIGLAGIGLSLTYSILNFANFAHGDYLTVGGFTGWAVAFIVAGLGQFDLGNLFLLTTASGGPSSTAVGINVTSTPIIVVVGLIAAVVLTVAVALVIDRLAYRPMRNADGISLLIASVGVAFILRYLIVFFWFSGKPGITDGYGARTTIAGVTINTHEVAVIVSAVVLMLGVHLLLQRTKLGKAMRAMADNRDLAQVTGIPVERVITTTWVVGAGLAGAAGYLVVLLRGTIIFDFGWVLLLLIFAAVILGGIGSVYGAIVGGLAIGMATEVSRVWLLGDLSGLTQPVAFGLMILILLIRPSGIFGGVKTA